MSHREPARRTTRRIPMVLLAGLPVVITAAAASVGYPMPSSASSTAPSSPPVSSSSSAAPRIPVVRGEAPGALDEAAGIVPRGAMVLRPEHRGALGVADGVVPDGTTVFNADIPGIANLDPDLLSALRHAATAATGDGVEFFVDSGWRSPAYQEQLLRQAIATYGSREEAARWVATPETSPHVSGNAVDIGFSDATAWLSEHGSEYGLCQIYGNEPWHYELRPEAMDNGCPPMYLDPAHDPRMHN